MSDSLAQVFGLAFGPEVRGRIVRQGETPAIACPGDTGGDFVPAANWTALAKVEFFTGQVSFAGDTAQVGNYRPTAAPTRDLAPTRTAEHGFTLDVPTDLWPFDLPPAKEGIAVFWFRVSEPDGRHRVLPYVVFVRRGWSSVA